MRNLVVAGVLATLATSFIMLAQANAQPIRAVRPIPGYSCMELNLTEQQMFDPNAIPPVMEQPSPRSRRIGLAASIVITAEPVRSQNGYVAMVMPNGKPGWVEAAKLQPYHSNTNPPARCVPSVMSNGLIGFAFPR